MYFSISALDRLYLIYLERKTEMLSLWSVSPASNVLELFVQPR